MLKKKHSIIYTAIVAIAAFTSCAKKLDIVPQGSPTSATFWQTQDDAIKAANAMYDQFDGEEFYGRGFMWFMNASDDMVTGRVKAQADNMKDFNSSYIGGSYTEPQWKMRYIVIKRANDIIRNVPAISMDESLKKRIIGEAYFLSGLMYFQMAANYGDERAGVPIIDRQNPSNYMIPRAKNVDENYAYIESDLKMAASMLPYFDQLSTDDYGRAHKTAAWAYLSKMYLYRKDYVNAEKYADSIMQSGKHALLPDFKTVFYIANNWSKEYIWSAVSNTLWGSILPGCMLENKGWGKYNGWGYYMPTQELYNAYEMGDKRREATILKPGDKFVYFGDSMTYSSSNSTSGYQFNKYMEPFSYPGGIHLNPNGDHPTTDLNVPLIRYAEIILIKAEAELMQGKNADNELNMIRKRAWGSSDENHYPKLSGATMNDLKSERRRELAGEWSDRHRDLVRWGDAQAAYAKPLHGAAGQAIWGARNFNPKVHNVWAVPQSEIDNSGGLITQNAGW